MGSLKDPKTWIPPKDCSQKICSIYCTKWCKYVILPSPPPPSQPPPRPPLVKDDLGGTTLSPIVIMVIALIGTFSLLMAYYVIISRYCTRNNESSSSSMLSNRVIVNQENHNLEVVVDGSNQEDDNSNYYPWLVLGKGLDEALIKSITMCKYKKGDGLVSCTECTVCLGEFQEDESIRLLPKCCHAFHVHCIDTWLKTHSNCPLCRANVCVEVKDSTLNSPPPPPTPPPLPRQQMMMTLDRREVIGSKSIGYLRQTRAPIAQVTFFNEAGELARQEVHFRDGAESSQHIS